MSAPPFSSVMVSCAPFDLSRRFVRKGLHMQGHCAMWQHEWRFFQCVCKCVAMCVDDQRTRGALQNNSTNCGCPTAAKKQHFLLSYGVFNLNGSREIVFWFCFFSSRLYQLLWNRLSHKKHAHKNNTYHGSKSWIALLFPFCIYIPPCRMQLEMQAHIACDCNVITRYTM